MGKQKAEIMKTWIRGVVRWAVLAGAAAGCAAWAQPASQVPLTDYSLTLLQSTNAVQARGLLGEVWTFEAQRTEKPRLGFGTFLGVWPGANFYAGTPGTNFYNGTTLDSSNGYPLNGAFNFATEAYVLGMCTNYLNDGLLALGYKWIFLAGGYWSYTNNSPVGTWNTNRFPSGGKGFCDKVHALGFKIAFYGDLSYYPVNSQNTISFGPTNVTFAANTLAYYGADYIWVDSIGWREGQTGEEYEKSRRWLYENVFLALRATNSNIGFAMNMNATPYAPWIGESFNGWQIAPAWDAPGWQSAIDSWDISVLSAAQFRPGHTPYWYEFNGGVLDANQDPPMTFVKSIYGTPLMTVGGAAMWQSDMHWPRDMIAENIRYINTGNGDHGFALLQTNRYILAIDQDSLYMPPRKLTSNGTVEAWVKPLANGTSALLVFNRGYAAAYAATNTSVPAVTATNVDIYPPSFGGKTNDLMTFTDIVAYTNKAAAGVFTINCNTNACSLWIVSPPAGSLGSYNGTFTGDGSGLYGINYTNTVRSEYITPLMQAANSGWTKLTPDVYSITPYFVTDGYKSTTAGTQAIQAALPWWTTNVTLTGWVFCTNSVTWTNTITVSVYTKVGGTRWQITPNPTAVVAATNGLTQWTVTAPIPATYIGEPRIIEVSYGAASPTVTRYTVGAWKADYQ